MATSRPLFPSAQSTDEMSKESPHFLSSRSRGDRSWLSNSSYRPVSPPLAHTHEDLPPPSKKAREKHRNKEQKDKKLPKPITNWFDDCSLAPQEAYRLDPCPDRANLQYNALYSGDIATYRRRFGGQCLGLGPHHAIEWTDNQGKKEVKKVKERGIRYFTSSLSRNDSCLYLASCQHTADSVSTESRLSHAPFFMALESATSMAREISEDKEEEFKASCGHELTAEAFISKQTATFNRTLQEDPHNVSLWLKFLEFRQVWGGCMETGTDPAKTAKAVRAVNERKLAIFERALEYNPISEELLVRHLELLGDMGREPDTLLKRWRDLVFRMPNKPHLWLKYTEFYKMQFSTFTLSSVSALYQKGISTLTAILEGVLKSHSPEPNTTNHLLALFAQFCHLLAAAGQNERAIACYQALMEYNFCCPPELASADSSTYKQKAAFFEPFWDSGAPRLGEKGAVGWSQWLKANQSQQVAKPLSLIDTHFLLHSDPSSAIAKDASKEGDPELLLIAGCSSPNAWLGLESYRQEQDALPFQGPEDELTDPERAVLFEDISQCMFTVNKASLQLKLVLQYLQFLGVLSPGAPCLDHLPHLISSHLYCAQDVLPIYTSPMCMARLASPSQYCSDTYPLYPHGFFGVSSGYSSVSTTDLLQLSSSTNRPPPPLATCHFISNTCNQLLSLLPDPEMQTVVALAWIQYELSLLAPSIHNPAQSKDSRHKSKVIQKLVKSLLKLNSHRNNLCLWDCCAQLELLLVGSEEAQVLYETVLSQYTIITPQLQPLYQHYCDVLLGLAKPLLTTISPSPSELSRALQVTVCVAEGRYAKPYKGHTIPASYVLRVRNLYEQKDILERPCSFTICHAYFEYLTRGIESACKVFEEYTSVIVSMLNSYATDVHVRVGKRRKLQVDFHHVCSCQVQLLLHHTKSKSMPPTLLWSTLERVLTSFPDDPYFLSAYTDCQQPLYLMGKLRKYFDTHAPKAQTALPWIHALRAEIARYQRVRAEDMDETTDVPAGLVNRIRALMNRATQSANGKGCPLLWRLAISFEVEQRRISEAKALFYQAIQYCPGAKVLYWDAISHFPDEMPRIMEVIEERELRIRAPLEEVQMLLDATTSS